MGTTVLGHYPDYVTLAKKIGATILDIPSDEWAKMNDVERWEKNRQFLDDAIARSDAIVLSSLLRESGGSFERELEYMKSKGFFPVTRGKTIMLEQVKREKR